jgi:hypothetical protein
MRLELRIFDFFSYETVYKVDHRKDSYGFKSNEPKSSKGRNIGNEILQISFGIPLNQMSLLS